MLKKNESFSASLSMKRAAPMGCIDSIEPRFSESYTMFHVPFCIASMFTIEKLHKNMCEAFTVLMMMIVEDDDC
jgi:hypothetical protein